MKRLKGKTCTMFAFMFESVSSFLNADVIKVPENHSAKESYVYSIAHFAIIEISRVLDHFTLNPLLARFSDSHRFNTGTTRFQYSTG